MFGRKKERTWDEIAEDPRTPYMVGRLLGANELAVALLRESTDDSARSVGVVLAHVTGYFLGQITKVEADHLENAPTLVMKRPEDAQ